jgi:hypothetical protein
LSPEARGIIRGSSHVAIREGGIKNLRARMFLISPPRHQPPQPREPLRLRHRDVDGPEHDFSERIVLREAALTDPEVLDRVVGAPQAPAPRKPKIKSKAGATLPDDSLARVHRGPVSKVGATLPERSLVRVYRGPDGCEVRNVHGQVS